MNNWGRVVASAGTDTAGAAVEGTTTSAGNAAGAACAGSAADRRSRVAKEDLRAKLRNPLEEEAAWGTSLASLMRSGCTGARQSGHLGQACARQRATTQLRWNRWPQPSETVASHRESRHSGQSRGICARAVVGASRRGASNCEIQIVKLTAGTENESFNLLNAPGSHVSRFPHWCCECCASWHCMSQQAACF